MLMMSDWMSVYVDLCHVVDCDSSQAAAIEETRSGPDLVLQGPPGTGKSQSIANVIASAVRDGKSVLLFLRKWLLCKL